MKEKLLAGLVFVLGCSALYLTATMNWRFGYGLANDPLQGWWHTNLDVMAYVGFIVAGMLIIMGLKRAGITAALITVCFAIYSIVNVIGYSASNRMAMAKAHEINLSNKIEARNNTIALNKEIIEKKIASEAQSVKLMVDKITDRRTWKSRAGMVSKNLGTFVKNHENPPKLEDVKAIEVSKEEAMPDAQAVIFSNLTGYDKETVQFTITGLGAILLLVVKGFCGIFAPILWNSGVGKAKNIPFLEKQEKSKDSRKPILVDLARVQEPKANDPVAILAASLDQDFLPWDHMKLQYRTICSKIGVDPLEPWLLANRLKSFGWDKYKPVPGLYARKEIGAMAQNG